MIGSKKLSTIRQELRHALSATADDPIVWLEKSMNALERRDAGASSEILRSLHRFLKGTGRKKQRKKLARIQKPAVAK